jgi:hypothetical protein
VGAPRARSASAARAQLASGPGYSSAAPRALWYTAAVPSTFAVGSLRARVNESKTCAVNVNMKRNERASKPNARKKPAAGPN